MKILLNLFICWCLVLSCSKSPLDKALAEAGDNRKELEKVLDYYQDDSLKLQAAEFLIENMPYHYAYEGKELVKYLKYFECFSMTWKGPEYVRDSLQRADGSFHFDSLHVVSDLKAVKADYLIRNIDFAFKVWREQPWGKKVSFQNFLEFILPYRIGTEALCDWREEIYNHYNPMLDSIRKTPYGTDIKAVARVLMDSLHKGPIYYTGIFPYGPNVGPKLVKWRSGNCRELTDLVIYVFRAVGLPCGCDKMLVRGDNNVSHFWNFILDEKDSTYFTSIGTVKLEKADTYWNPKGKVYRETFSLNTTIQKNLSHNSGNVPDVFRMPILRDVTSIYAGRNNRCLRIGSDSLVITPDEGETVYLCASSKMQWLPIAYGLFKNDTVYVDDVEGDVVFRLAVYRNKGLMFISLPFLLERYSGNIRFFRPTSQNRQVTLFQKFKEDFLYDMLYGVFEASNRRDFLKRDTLYYISECPLRLQNTVYSSKSKSYRYVRYYGPKGHYCQIAEFSFYESPKDSMKLCGSLIYPQGVPTNIFVNQFTRVIDDNPYTSMNYYEPSGGWVGLDFGHPVHIGKIVYTPRNRDNFIRIGDEYELFYATEQDWKSLGVKRAMSDSLDYQIPVGALLYLKNHTRGNDERIFEMVDGRQKLW